MNKYLELPWGMEDTILNMKMLKEILSEQAKIKNYDGKGNTDVKEIEFDFDRVIFALEKQIPKKPIKKEKQYSEDYGFNSDILCPNCKAYIGYYTEAMSKPEYMKYCNQCGQRIDDNWSDEDE